MKSIFFKPKLLFLILILTINCNDKDEVKDCGCDSPVIKVISDTDNMSGKIYYKTKTDPNDNYYNNKFWISVDGLAVNWSQNLIVCNENILPTEILNLKNSGETISIKFSGDLKKLCENTISIPEDSFEHITLTKLQKQ